MDRNLLDTSDTNRHDGNSSAPVAAGTEEAAAGCQSDELSFSLEYARFSGDGDGDSYRSSWHLDGASSSSGSPGSDDGVLLLDGTSYSGGYPRRVCLPKDACYRLAAAYHTDGLRDAPSLLCREMSPTGTSAYVLRVDGAITLNGCVSSNRRYDEPIQFGSCEHNPSPSPTGSSNPFDWNDLPSPPSTSGSEPYHWGGRGGGGGDDDDGHESFNESNGNESRFGFFFVVLVILAVVGCSARRKRRSGRARRADGVRVTPGPGGAGQRAGVRATRGAREPANPSPSAPGIDAVSPAFGSEQRNQFVKESLITKDLTAIDVAPVTDDKDGELDSHSTRSFGRPAKERSDFVQSSIRSLEVRMSKPDPAKEHESVTYSDGVCTICLEAYREGDTVCSSNNPGCTHAFHAECMTGWLLRHEDCPNCRLQYLDGAENV